MECKQYKNNFLEHVIFRIDFSPILKIANTPPSEFQEKVRSIFPRMNRSDLISITNSLKQKPGTTEIETVKEKVIIPMWEFLSQDEKKKIELRHDNFVIEYLKYDSFADFNKNVMLAYTAFLDLYKPVDIKRIGLRYVNNIVLPEGNPFEWKDYINEALVYPLDNHFDEVKDLARHITQMTVIKDNFKIVFTYGIVNPEYPNKISRKEFALDFDCSTNEVTEQSVLQSVDDFHKNIYSYFEKSINEGLRTKMEVIQ